MSIHHSFFGSVELPDVDELPPAPPPPRRRPGRPPATARPAGGIGMTVFETTGQVALRVSLSGGEVSIETVDAPRVEIELVALRDNDVTRQAIEEARVEMTDRGGGHQVVVELKRKSGFLVGRGPAGRRAGALSRGHRRRPPRRLRRPRGARPARRGRGQDRVRRRRRSTPRGRSRVNTASGDVRAGDIEGRVEVRTASGDVRVRRSGGVLSANLVSGDLSVDDAAAGLDVTTVSGDVEVRAAGGGGIRVQAVSGDVAARHQARRAPLHRRQLRERHDELRARARGLAADRLDRAGERASGAHDQRRSEDRAGRRQPSAASGDPRVTPRRRDARRGVTWRSTARPDRRRGRAGAAPRSRHGARRSRAASASSPAASSRPQRRIVEILGERRDGAAVELERAARIAAGREQKLRATERRVELGLVDRHAPAGEEAQQRPLLLRRSVLGGADPVAQAVLRHRQPQPRRRQPARSSQAE